MDMGLLLGFELQIVNPTALFSYLFLKQKRHFSIKLLKINGLMYHYPLPTGTINHTVEQDVTPVDRFLNALNFTDIPVVH